jgi:hypothetical protein
MQAFGRPRVPSLGGCGLALIGTTPGRHARRTPAAMIRAMPTTRPRWLSETWASAIRVGKQRTCRIGRRCECERMAA